MEKERHGRNPLAGTVLEYYSGYLEYLMLYRALPLTRNAKAPRPESDLKKVT